MLRKLALSCVLVGSCVPLVMAGCGSDEKFSPPPTGQGGGSTVGSGGSGGGSTTTTGGNGGTGGMACNDADMDGVTDCAGDCDDNDPNVNPNLPEVCGDGADNDCDGDADPPATCNGLGTYVSALTGDDTTGDGTKTNPVQTIAQGIANAQTLANGQAVYVAEGLYPEKITVVEGVSLLGGHQCDTAACTWARDPASYDAAIYNQDDEGVYVGHLVTRATLIDGFRVVAQSGNPGSSGTIVGITVDQSTPTISNNTVVGGQVVNCTGCGTVAILLLGPSNDMLGTLIDVNHITAGDSSWASSAIGFRNYQMAPVAEITGNAIEGGSGTYTRAVEAFACGAGTVISNNDISAGSTIPGGSNRSSFAMIVSGNAGMPSQIVVDSNRINTNPALVGNCLNSTFWCGGIETEGATATISNNVVYGMPAAQRSVAVYLGEGEVPFGDVIINGNTLHGGGTPNNNTALSAALGCRTTQGNNAKVGRIRNNVLLGGTALNRFGFYEDDQNTPRTCEPVAYENNDIFFSALATATDTIHRQWTSGGTQVLITDIATLNGLSYAAANIDGDPLLDATWHLQAGSPCIDAGSATDAPATDFEGETRPKGAGIDIGADEAM